MHLIEIDPVGLQAAQTRFDRRHDVASRRAFLQTAASIGKPNFVATTTSARRRPSASRAVLPTCPPTSPGSDRGVEQRDAVHQRRLHDDARGRRIEPAARLLQPRPTAETRSPDVPRLRSSTSSSPMVFDHLIGFELGVHHAAPCAPSAGYRYSDRCRASSDRS